jgi:putative nucleotidyltransferase with HDIG domain
VVAEPAIRPPASFVRIDSHLKISHISETTEIERLCTLIDIVRERDLRTYEHSWRVAIYARRLAHALGYDRQMARDYARIGLLHDAGKIWIGESLLNKRDLLTHDEHLKIRDHAVFGAQMISGYDLPTSFMPGVRHHHEAYDGSGYPDGLAGEDIPDAARLVAIVDAYDVITSGRPYNTAASPDIALSEITMGAGKQFDPHMVEAFVRMNPARADFVLPISLDVPATGTARDIIATEY